MGTQDEVLQSRLTVYIHRPLCHYMVCYLVRKFQPVIKTLFRLFPECSSRPHIGIFPVVGGTLSREKPIVPWNYINALLVYVICGQSGYGSNKRFPLIFRPWQFIKEWIVSTACAIT